MHATNASETPSARMQIIDAEVAYDVFEVLELLGDIARVRSNYLFEVGEELAVRVEQDGHTFDAVARIRAHVGTQASRVTELQLVDRGEPRKIVAG